MNPVHEAALVIIPPKEFWQQIDVVREQHDKAYGRWMPHINILYPFVKQSDWLNKKADVSKAAESLAPFEIVFDQFQSFDFAKSVLWLRPKPTPSAALQNTQRAFFKIFPSCTENTEDYTPHMTVGQFPRGEVATRKNEFAFLLRNPIRFQVDEIMYITRGKDTPFEVTEVIKLGGAVKDSRREKTSLLEPEDVLSADDVMALLEKKKGEYKDALESSKNLRKESIVEARKRRQNDSAGYNGEKQEIIAYRADKARVQQTARAFEAKKSRLLQQRAKIVKTMQAILCRMEDIKKGVVVDQISATAPSATVEPWGEEKSPEPVQNATRVASDTSDINKEYTFTYEIPTNPNHWKAEQVTLAEKVKKYDDLPFHWPPNIPSTGRPPLKYIGGLDISVEGTKAVCALAILEFPSLLLVKEAHYECTINVTYKAGFLAFRELPAILGCLRDFKSSNSDIFPQVLILDGYGILHYRGLGLASHLGVVTGIVTIGCAKKILNVDGLENKIRQMRDRAKVGLDANLRSKGLPVAASHTPAKEITEIPLVGDSGTQHGVALSICVGDGRSDLAFCSPGHRISVGTAAEIVRACSVQRVCEPVRLADKLSRGFLASMTGVKGYTPESVSIAKEFMSNYDGLAAESSEEGVTYEIRDAEVVSVCRWDFTLSYLPLGSHPQAVVPKCLLLSIDEDRLMYSKVKVKVKCVKSPRSVEVLLVWQVDLGPFALDEQEESNTDVVDEFQSINSVYILEQERAAAYRQLKDVQLGLQELTKEREQVYKEFHELYAKHGRLSDPLFTSLVHLGEIKSEIKRIECVAVRKKSELAEFRNQLEYIKDEAEIENALMLEELHSNQSKLNSRAALREKQKRIDEMRKKLAMKRKRNNDALMELPGGRGGRGRGRGGARGGRDGSAGRDRESRPPRGPRRP